MACSVAPLLLRLLPGCEYLPPLFPLDEEPASTPTGVPVPADAVSEVVVDLGVKVRGLCATADSLFVTRDDMRLAEYDLDTFALSRELRAPIQVGPNGLGDCAIHEGYLYYANVGRDSIGRLDLAEGTHLPDWAPSPGGQPRAVVTDSDGLVWVSSDDAPDLQALDPETGQLAATIPGPGLCSACDGLAAVEAGLWCTEGCQNEMILIGWDGSLVEELESGWKSWYGLAFVGDELWGGPVGGFGTEVRRITREEGSWGEPVR